MKLKALTKKKLKKKQIKERKIINYTKVTKKPSLPNYAHLIKKLPKSPNHHQKKKSQTQEQPPLSIKADQQITPKTTVPLPASH